FVELDAPPGRVLALDQILVRDAGRRMVQDADGLRKRHEAVAAADVLAERVAQIGIAQRLIDGAPQGRLAQPVGGGINRGERIGQCAVRDGDARVDHFEARESAPELAPHPYALAPLDLALLAGIEIEPAQGEAARAVLDHGHQLAARPELHFAVQNLALDLSRLARTQRADGLDAGFVLVAQRQMDDEVLLPLQAKAQEAPLHGALRIFLPIGRCGPGSLAPGRGAGHGSARYGVMRWGSVGSARWASGLRRR